jgi:hypothetical protein
MGAKLALGLIGAMVAGLCIPPALGSVAAADVWYATSKNGATHCKVSRVAAHCQVKDPRWDPPRRAAHCARDKRPTIGFASSEHRARFSCSRRIRKGPTYDSHTFFRKGHIRCRAIGSGFRCVDRAHRRRAFTITRARFSLRWAGAFTSALRDKQKSRFSRESRGLRPVSLGPPHRSPRMRSSRVEDSVLERGAPSDRATVLRVKGRVRAVDYLNGG